MAFQGRRLNAAFVIAAFVGALACSSSGEAKKVCSRGSDGCAIRIGWHPKFEARQAAGIPGRPSGVRGSDLIVFPGIRTHSSRRFHSMHDLRTSHAGVGGGGDRSSAMSRRMSANRFRGMATSAI
jgi:hypothetical protein